MSWVIWRVFRKMKIIFGFTCSTSFPLSSTRTVSPPEVSQFVGQYLGSWFRVSLVSMCTLSHCLCICLGQFVGQYVGSWFWFSPVTVFSLCAIVSTVQDANSVLHRKFLGGSVWKNEVYWQNRIYIHEYYGYNLCGWQNSPDGCLDSLVCGSVHCRSCFVQDKHLFDIIVR